MMMRLILLLLGGTAAAWELTASVAASSRRIRSRPIHLGVMQARQIEVGASLPDMAGFGVEIVTE